MNPRTRGRRFAIAFLAVTAIGTAFYWLAFFATGAVHVRGDAVYLAFERAFPLADAWMATCAMLGAIGLGWRRPWGFLFGLLAASSMIFLGCMDVLFNLNEGNYAIDSVEMTIEILINATLLVGAPLLIVHLWRHRSELLQ